MKQNQEFPARKNLSGHRHFASGTADEAGSREDGSTIYTCPMHPEVRQLGPGNCPKCNMHLVPESDAGPPPDHSGRN